MSKKMFFYRLENDSRIQYNKKHMIKKLIEIFSNTG